MDILKEIGQTWLTDDWANDGSDEEQRKQFFAQIESLDKQYPGGLKKYVANARHLLEDSKEGKNPFEGCTPKVPASGLVLDFGNPEFLRFEAMGLDEIQRTGIVLVAGGLGERLGYPGIKLELPVETTMETCYLQFYVEYLDALQKEKKSPKKIPLAIMTSGDTHEKTVALLEKNKYFGRDSSTILLMKQEKVPSICDATGKFVKADKYTLETKPHGHGDVHQLLYSSGIAKKWEEEGLKWLVFIQDTNAMVFNTTQGALGLSAEKKLEVNSISISRKPGEAIGAITQLVSADKHPLTICVEYNQLGPLLSSTGDKKGDIADATGLSPYPGNINTLVFALGPYNKILADTHGLMPEFVNPKYADEAKTTFKKPTRLECMMQDYPKLLKDEDGTKVGFTAFSRVFAFSPVKNSISEALGKLKAGLDANCAASAEAEFYHMHAERLRLCGCTVAQGTEERVFNEIPVTFGPRVVLHPSFAPTHAALASKVGAGLRVSAQSTLAVSGANIKIDNLELDGALVIKVADGAKLHIKNLKVSNAGWVFKEAPADAAPAVAVRGFVFDKKETKELIFSEGEHTIDEA